MGTRVLSLIVSLLPLLMVAPPVRASMTFYAIAVGQGDSCIIQCPNQKDIIILDMGGTQPQYIIPAYITHLLKDKFHAADPGKNIHIIISHSHTDHYSYFSRAVDSDLLPNVREVILGGDYEDYGKTLRAWFEENLDNVYTINHSAACFGNTNCTLTSTRTGEPIQNLQRQQQRRKGRGRSGKRRGMTLSEVSDPWQLCDSSSVKFTVLGANLGNTQNGQSIVLKITYNSWSMLMSGDFEMITPQKDLMKAWPESTFRSNYYKVAHHGAWTDKKPNLPDLLDLIQPKRVYISQGYPDLSKFHHPNSVTIENLEALSSIVKIDKSTNAPFVYWDNDKQESVELEDGMDRGIYETCRQYYPNNATQLCHDILIISDGHSDTTAYMDVPSEYLYKSEELAEIKNVDN